MPCRGEAEVERCLTSVLHILMDVKPHTWAVAEWFRGLLRRTVTSPENAARHAMAADELLGAAIRQVRDLLEWGPKPPAPGQLVLLVPEPEHLTAPAWTKAA